MQTSVDYKALYEQQLKTGMPDYKSLYEEGLKIITDLRFTIEALTHQVAQFQKMIFGSKHERFEAADPDNLLGKNSVQLSLGLEADTISACKITDAKEVKYIRTKTEVTPNKPHPGRSALPDHLRRETIILQPDTDVSGLKKIGDEVTEILDLIPGELYVKQYIRPKYVVPVSEVNDTIITASLPARLMEKCMFGEGLMAQILIDKYCDHLPLHRQMQRFSRAGVTIAQSTMNSATTRALDSLFSLYEAHKKMVLESKYLHVDETGIKVMDESKKGTTHSGFYWVYHNSKDKMVLFDYRTGRGREGPDDILKEYQGYLQTDGYSVYEGFEKRPGIKMLNCMAHARRKFVDAQQNDAPRARHALSLFQKLYDTERTIKEDKFSDEASLQFRQKEAVPVLKELEQWMKEEYPKVTPSSVIGKAIAYCLPRWKKLSLYTTDAILNIDNNPVENAIRPVAIGRKNYLFAGSHDAAQRSAMVYSLFATCRLHNINPYEWLKDVLERMHLYTTSNIKELLPQFWKTPEV